MAYRKLGRDNKHRRSMLATLTKQVIMNESITTTDTRAKEVRKFVDKMITYGKRGDLISRRKALAFLHNDTVAVNKVFNELTKRYENRNGGYTQILKVGERRGDNSLMSILRLVVEEEPVDETRLVHKEDYKDLDWLPDDKRKWYVIDTNFILSCVDIIYDPDDEDWRMPLDLRPSLDNAHIIIPAIVFEELNHNW